MVVRTGRRALLLGGAALPLAACAPAEDVTSTPTSSPSTPTSTTPSPTPSATSAAPTPTPTPTVPAEARLVLAGEVASGLAVPWGVAFLPDGSALVGERDTGRVLWLVTTGGDPVVVGTLDVRSRVDQAGESGLLGLALHPTEDVLYAYTSVGEGNRVVRMPYAGSLGEPEVVLDGIGASVHHNGGGLAFGPDGALYVSTGDAEDPSAAPDPSSYDGKVLRVALGGADVDVWSRGHRNVEGLAFDEQGRLWASEFGDKGADELNLIEQGKDYGWPAVEGDSGGEYADPLATWPVEECSPAGIAIAAGRAWLGALRGECVWSVVLDGPDAGRTERHLTGEHGRIRAVAAAPDGALWVTTSNRDGRTEPGPDDDRVLRFTIDT
jgi:glucose/arabinose dehydrogenase